MNTHWLNTLPKPLAFVFSGGAALGAVQVGMLRGLATFGVMPDLVTGTSVGALNASVIAAYGLMDGLRQLEQLWATVTKQDVFPGGRLTIARHFLLHRTSLYSNHGLRELIERVLPVRRFEDLRLPFGALAADLMTYHGALFTAGELIAPLLASAAIPGVYPPVRINGIAYVDGALSANVPLKAAVEMGAKSLIVLDAGEMCHRTHEPTTVVEMFMATLHAAMRQRSRVEAGALAQQIPLVYLPTPCSMNEDNTVLYQLVAKGCLTNFRQQFHEMKTFGLVKFVARQTAHRLVGHTPTTTRNSDPAHLRDPDFHLDALRHREEHLVSEIAQEMKRQIDRGESSADALLTVQNDLLKLANAFVERVLLEQFLASIAAVEDAAVSAMLQQVAALFALTRIEQDAVWFLEHGYISSGKSAAIRSEVDALLFELRHQAVHLVNAFGIPDALLAAPIAA